MTHPKRIPLIVKHHFALREEACRYCEGTGKMNTTPISVWKRDDSAGVGRTIYARLSRTSKIHVWRPHEPWRAEQGHVEWRACYLTWDTQPLVLAEPLDMEPAEDLCKICVPMDKR